MITTKPILCSIALLLLFLTSCGSVSSNKLKFQKTNRFNTTSSLSQSSQTKNKESYDSIIPTIESYEEINTYASITESTPENQSPIKFNSLLEDKCDVIMLRDGKEENVKILEVGVNEIKYYKCGNLNGPIYTILKEDVFMITYSNGSKDVFKEKSIVKNESPKEELSSPIIKRAHPAGVLSLILGIVALGVGGLLAWPVTILGLPAFILGIVGVSSSSNHPEKYKGVVASVFGIIFGLIAIAGFILLLLAL